MASHSPALDNQHGAQQPFRRHRHAKRGANNANSSFAGVLADNNNGSGGVLALTKIGSGVLTLNGANTFSGPTTISGGTLQLGNANAAQNRAVSVGVANGLAFSPGLGTVNIGGLSGGSNFALADTASGSLTLSVGGNNQTTTYSGDISGPGTLLKTGAGASGSARRTRSRAARPSARARSI